MGIIVWPADIEVFKNQYTHVPDHEGDSTMSMTSNAATYHHLVSGSVTGQDCVYGMQNCSLVLHSYCHVVCKLSHRFSNLLADLDLIFLSIEKILNVLLTSSKPNEARAAF